MPIGYCNTPRARAEFRPHFDTFTLRMVVHMWPPNRTKTAGCLDLKISDLTCLGQATIHKGLECRDEVISDFWCPIAEVKARQTRLKRRAEIWRLEPDGHPGLHDPAVR